MVYCGSLVTVLAGHPSPIAGDAHEVRHILRIGPLHVPFPTRLAFFLGDELLQLVIALCHMTICAELVSGRSYAV